MVVVAFSGVTEAIDLRRDVVVDEQGATVPCGLGRVLIHQHRQILLALHPFRGSKRNDFSRVVTRPFVRVAIVQNTQIIDLPLLHRSERRKARRIGHLVQRSYFIILAPNPTPTFPFLPFFDGR